MIDLLAMIGLCLLAMAGRRLSRCCCRCGPECTDCTDCTPLQYSVVFIDVEDLDPLPANPVDCDGCFDGVAWIMDQEIGNQCLWRYDPDVCLNGFGAGFDGINMLTDFTGFVLTVETTSSAFERLTITSLSTPFDCDVQRTLTYSSSLFPICDFTAATATITPV